MAALIHLDTSFLIPAVAPGSSASRQYERWMQDKVAVRVSAVAWAEYLCGPAAPDVLMSAAWFLGEPIAVHATSAELAALLYNMSGRRRGSLADCLIAATAIIDDAELVTANRSDFERMVPAGLRLVDWE